MRRHSDFEVQANRISSKAIELESTLKPPQNCPNVGENVRLYDISLKHFTHVTGIALFKLIG